VERQVASDPAYGEALLRGGIDTMLTGDVDTGKAIFRVVAVSGGRRRCEMCGQCRTLANWAHGLSSGP
jgi:hypothetical protein